MNLLCYFGYHNNIQIDSYMLYSYLHTCFGEDLFRSLSVKQIVRILTQLVRNIPEKHLIFPSKDVLQYSIEDTKFESIKEYFRNRQESLKQWIKQESQLPSYRRNEREHAQQRIKELKTDLSAILTLIPVVYCTRCYLTTDYRKEHLPLIRGIAEGLKRVEMNEKSGLYLI